MGRSDGRGAPAQAPGVCCMRMSRVVGAWVRRAAAAGWPSRWRRACSSVDVPVMPRRLVISPGLTYPHSDSTTTGARHQPYYYNSMAILNIGEFFLPRWGIRFLILAAFCTGTSHPPKAFAGPCAGVTRPTWQPRGAKF